MIRSRFTGVLLKSSVYSKRSCPERLNFGQGERVLVLYCESG